MNVYHSIPEDSISQVDVRHSAFPTLPMTWADLQSYDYILQLVLQDFSKSDPLVRGTLKPSTFWVVKTGEGTSGSTRTLSSCS